MWNDLISVWEYFKKISRGSLKGDLNWLKYPVSPNLPNTKFKYPMQQNGSKYQHLCIIRFARRTGTRCYNGWSVAV